jgi:protein TonB
MRDEFPQSNWKFTPILAFVGALVMAIGLFLLVPLTQTLNAVAPETVTYREVALASPPPPKATPPTKQSEASQQSAAKKPQLAREVAKLSLSQLEISLNPGMGAPLTMGMQQMQFDGEIDVVGDIEKIFEFDDLPQPPSLINQSQLSYTYPRDLTRRGVGDVTVVMQVIIDENGRTTVQKLLSTSYQNSQIEKEARRVAEKARFTVTKVDGRAVKVRAKFPLKLRPPR